MKFGMMTHFQPLKPSDGQKFEFKNIQDGGLPPSLKPLNRHISAMAGPIAVKFSMIPHFDPV